MKLLVILLCLFSERYLIHTVSHLRFNWFSSYCKKIAKSLPRTSLILNPAVMLVVYVAPLILLVALTLFIADHLLFGIIAFILNLLIFYYCLGRNNPFYPIRLNTEDANNELSAGAYFAEVNGQLFSVVFWYVVTGALGLVLYRLISLCREKKITAKLAEILTNILDWIPARITVLFYLLVGNFQKGFPVYTQQFLLPPDKNQLFLSEGGLMAARTNENEPVQLPYAETLVEHAIIVYLVCLAIFTLVALM